MSDGSDLEITKEWLLSIGGKRHESGYVRFAVGNSLVLEAHAFRGACQSWLLQSGDAVQLRDTTDRADLLRLIAALKGGVE